MLQFHDRFVSGKGVYMALKAQLMEDMKNAMRAHDSVKLNAIRFLQSDIKNTEIDNGELDDAGVTKVIMKQVKQMNDVIVDYKKADRQDLVEEEQAKIDVLSAYLPKQMSDDDINAIIDRVMAEAAEPNMGQVIGGVMKEVGAQADGGRVSALVRAKMAA